jgi:hypothetical protein
MQNFPGTTILPSNKEFHVSTLMQCKFLVCWSFGRGKLEISVENVIFFSSTTFNGFFFDRLSTIIPIGTQAIGAGGYQKSNQNNSHEKLCILCNERS